MLIEAKNISVTVFCFETLPERQPMWR